MPDDPRVLKCEIKISTDPFDLSFLQYGGGSAVAFLDMDDGSLETFNWYHDELSFNASEFIGKTMAEIRGMHREKDMRYLRS